MSDYTPTTEEVREYYAPARVSGAADETLRAEFDRWLAEVKAEQDKATTERIIALLENDRFGKDLDYLVALIKGTVANNATVEPVGKTDKLGENK